MATPHIESNKEDIADIVLMPGDPLRAKYIAEHYLDNYKLINEVRNMFGYTGYYKGKRVTVFASGMGIPSACIYTHELFSFYDVKKIIRIGSCGSLKPSIKPLDLVLATSAYSKTNFDELIDNKDVNEVESSNITNNNIISAADRLNIDINIGKIITSDAFYAEDNILDMFPKDDYLAVEMEAFGIFYLAKKLNKEASCILTVVDSKYDKKVISSENREKSLDKMITLALESIL
ncbi:MAG TPA: purine-nucleoside phosphorylase [Bacilli bacterium]|nr:purine-nucleoside phosphorylase [Bacilli bacterium]